MKNTVTAIIFNDGSNEYVGCNAYTAQLIMSDGSIIELTGDENGCLWNVENSQIADELEAQGIQNNYTWLSNNAIS